MAKVVYIIYTYIIAQVATDYGAVIQTHCHTQVMKFQVKGFQFTNANQPVKFTILNEFGVEIFGNEELIPVIRSIAVAHKHFYFLFG